MTHQKLFPPSPQSAASLISFVAIRPRDKIETWPARGSSGLGLAPDESRINRTTEAAKMVGTDVCVVCT